MLTDALVASMHGMIALLDEPNLPAVENFKLLFDVMGIYGYFSFFFETANLSSIAPAQSN